MNKLEYVHNKLSKYYQKHPNTIIGVLNEHLAESLGISDCSVVLHKLVRKPQFDDFAKWNESLNKKYDYPYTSVEQFNKVYDVLVNVKF